MHDRDRAATAFVSQIGKVLRQLHCGEHALVGDRAAGQRREIDTALFGPLAQRVHQAVEVDPAGAGTISRGRGDEQHRHVRHTAQCGRADFGSVGGVDRNGAPAEDLDALLGRDGLDAFDGGPPIRRVLGGQEADTGRKGVAPVGCWRGQLEVDNVGEQFDRQLQQDACAVSAVGFGTRGAAVFEVLQRGQSVSDDLVRPPALDVGHHRHTARVGLVLWVVETLRFGKC